jgi:hypothetical protein
VPKLSLAGFKNPVTRPRFIIWTFVAVLALAAFMIVMLGATSTYWFCGSVCHKVQDDTIHAYGVSAHSKISCMACHEPSDANPITFLLKKVKSGLEVIPTVGNTFELPLNAGSALALSPGEMGSAQCTQCHSGNREITPSRNLKIDHAAHADAGIWCTVCHNRTAHDESNAPPTLVAPNGRKNVAHQNFMKMSACFRCHDLDGVVKMTGPGAKAASGACATCHPAGFELKPASHRTAEWSAKAHGVAALEAGKKAAEQGVESKKLTAEGIPAYLTAPVNDCYTCHSKKQFCTKCHGIDMPHEPGFDKSHKTVALKDILVCQKCHVPTGVATGIAAGTTLASAEIPFCENCHHKGGEPGVAWLKAHPAVVAAKGTVACFKCHSPTVCAKCHVRGGK